MLKTETKKLILIFLILYIFLFIILFLISGCTKYYAYPELETCNKISDRLVKSDCYQLVAEAKLDERVCLDNYCFLDVVKRKGDASLCAEAPSLIRKQCWIDLTGNCSSCPEPSLEECSNLKENEKDWCYVRIARETNNESICEEFSKGPPKDQCYFGIATVRKDSEYCRKIDDKEFARQDCFSHLASLTNNSGLCSQIYNQVERGRCYRTLALALQDETLCHNAYNVEGCLLEVQKESECSVIQDKSYKNFCYQFGGISPEEENCLKIESMRDKSNCYRQIARIKRDVSYCDKMLEYTEERFKSTFFDMCVSLAATQDTLCSSVDNKYFQSRDICYANAAAASGDSKLCSGISTRYAKDLCYKAVVCEMLTPNNNECRVGNVVKFEPL